MSKKKHKNVTETVNDVVETTEIKEETEMTEKKGLKGTIKELGNKVPKPVKVIGGIALGVTTLAGAAYVAWNKLRDNSVDDTDLCDDEDFEVEDNLDETDAAEAEAPSED